MLRSSKTSWLATFFAIALVIRTADAIPLTPIERIAEKAANSVRLMGDSWADCGNGATELLVKNVTMSPFPVQVGKDFTLNIDTVNDNSVLTSGSIKSEVYLVGVPVYSETDDLCSKHACPVEVGPVHLGITTFLPNTTPPGWYTLTIRGVDQDGLPSLCADIKFTISPWGERSVTR